MTQTIGLDKSQPYRVIKDFSTNRSVFVQDGRSYNEQGFPLLVATDSAVKYLCPQCDFRTASAPTLYGHAEKVHQASDVQQAVLAVYVENINRGFNSDEGIDWARMTVARTGKQKARDEADAKEGLEKETPPAVVKVGEYLCKLCPGLPGFTNGRALGSHRWNKHQIKSKK